MSEKIEPEGRKFSPIQYFFQPQTGAAILARGKLVTQKDDGTVFFTGRIGQNPAELVPFAASKKELPFIFDRRPYHPRWCTELPSLGSHPQRTS